LYAYVRNNPLNRLDPLGLCENSLVAAGSAAFELAALGIMESLPVDSEIPIFAVAADVAGLAVYGSLGVVSLGVVGVALYFEDPAGEPPMEAVPGATNDMAPPSNPNGPPHG
jgi:hypothetical protein